MPRSSPNPPDQPDEDIPEKMDDLQLGGPTPDERDEEPQFRDRHPPSRSHCAEDRHTGAADRSQRG